MSSKGEPWSLMVVLTECIVDGSVLITDSKLGTDLYTLVLGDLADIPGGEARRVSKVGCSMVRIGGVEEAVVVHLFTWVVLVNVLSFSFEVVHAVLHRINGA